MFAKTTKLAVLLIAALFAASVWANDVQGEVQAIDSAAGTLTVQGITFHVVDTTNFDDGLRSLADVQVGMRVEIDFAYIEGRHIALEIERDD